nr:ribosomal protein S1-like protein [Cavernulicola chilensis]
MNKLITFKNENFADLIKEYKYEFSPGDIVAGTVINVEKEGILVDIGTLRLAYLPEPGFSIKPGSNRQKQAFFQANEIHEFIIIAKHKSSQQFILALKKLEKIRGWQRLRQLANEDLVINGYPLKLNSGGAIVYVEGIKGFIPNSHMPSFIQKEALISQIWPLKILEINKVQNQLILSYKNALIDKIQKKFKRGDTILGTIYRIKPYGLLIDIESVMGLLHISEISGLSDNSLYDLFQINQNIEVKLLYIDSQDGKVMLSTKGV